MGVLKWDSYGTILQMPVPLRIYPVRGYNIILIRVAEVDGSLSQSPEIPSETNFGSRGW